MRRRNDFLGALERSGFSQAEFARLGGRDKTTVNRWVAGKPEADGYAWLVLDLIDVRPELKHVIRDLMR